MENSEIINLWKTYDKKLEESLVFNRKNAEEITKMKVQSFLSSMKPMKIFAILIGIIWVAFVDLLIFNLFHIANPFFLVSAIIQVLISKLAIGIYVYQLILIQQLDINEPILYTQKRLSWLKSSTLWVVRFSFLQLPIWTTFYWNKSMFENGNIWLYAFQIIMTVSFTVLAIWLFLNIKYENRDKKWFRILISGIEWNPVMKSMELLSQINEFSKETSQSEVQESNSIGLSV
jgi:hypothetical protein